MVLLWLFLTSLSTREFFILSGGSPAVQFSIFKARDYCTTVRKKLSTTLQMSLFLLTEGREVLSHAILDLKTFLD